MPILEGQATQQASFLWSYSLFVASFNLFSHTHCFQHRLNILNSRCAFSLCPCWYPSSILHSHWLFLIGLWKLSWCLCNCKMMLIMLIQNNVCRSLTMQLIVQFAKCDCTILYHTRVCHYWTCKGPSPEKLHLYARSSHSCAPQMTLHEPKRILSSSRQQITMESITH